MKHLTRIAISYILTLTACTKSVQEDNGCIERIFIPMTAHSINSTDIASVNNLFISNGIDNSKFRYYRYIHDTLQTLYPPYIKYDQKMVRLDQYTNGVRIFTADLVYNFLNNGFNYRGGNLTTSTFMDTLSTLKLGQIRKLFLDNIEQFDHARNKFKDTCIKAEFGFFNLNAGISNAQEVLVKAWRASPKNAVFPSEYPMAYYQDKDGKLICYDNGIRTFK